MTKRRRSAIDLYSGVGGWSLGLKMAGIDVVAAYDCWIQANLTYKRNLGLAPINVDLRNFPASDFPTGVDFVVGSPPCIRFSLSNRGGNGDVKDGLEDIRVFLEAVRAIRPQYWVMENVPRVGGILEKELGEGGSLHEFKDLVDVVAVIDLSKYGLPQRRRRMFAGSFPIKLLESYAGREVAATLGTVIESLRTNPVRDPLYDIELPADQLRDNERESPLGEEETRLNSQAKQAHRVYNRMLFPDPLDRAARTLTAVCTRVSRESIVVDDSGYGMRRPTLRERAVLQGFPITFQFYGTSQKNQQRLIGNAVPPLFAYHVGLSLQERPASDVQRPRGRRLTHRLPSVLPTLPESRVVLRTYPKTRRFRSVIPNLGFGSGVRFELVNRVLDDDVSWVVLFYFGTPKDIRALPLDASLLSRSRHVVGNGKFPRRMEGVFPSLASFFKNTTGVSVQRAWNRSGPGTHPFQVVDRLSEASANLRQAVPTSARESISSFVWHELECFSGPGGPRPAEKLTGNAGWIYCGMVLGSWFNSEFA